MNLKMYKAWLLSLLRSQQRLVFGLTFLVSVDQQGPVRPTTAEKKRLKAPGLCHTEPRCLDFTFNADVSNL